MKITIFLLLTIPFSSDLTRIKRTLLWPTTGGKVQLIVGVGLPLVLRDEAVIVGTVIKTNYALPHNSSSYLSPTVERLRKKRQTSRWELYEALAQIFQIHGYGGKECILRTICEVANGSLHQGLLEELIHTIFTPSASYEKISYSTDNMYYTAEIFGKENSENCQRLFPECKINLLNALTIEAD